MVQNATIMKKVHQSTLIFTATTETHDDAPWVRYTLARDTTAGHIEMDVLVAANDSEGYSAETIQREVFKHLSHQITAREAECLADSKYFGNALNEKA